MMRNTHHRFLGNPLSTLYSICFLCFGTVKIFSIIVFSCLDVTILTLGNQTLHQFNCSIRFSKSCFTRFLPVEMCISSIVQQRWGKSNIFFCIRVKGPYHTTGRNEAPEIACYLFIVRYHCLNSYFHFA